MKYLKINLTKYMKNFSMKNFYKKLMKKIDPSPNKTRKISNIHRMEDLIILKVYTSTHFTDSLYLYQNIIDIFQRTRK